MSKTGIFTLGLVIILAIFSWRFLHNSHPDSALINIHGPTPSVTFSPAPTAASSTSIKPSSSSSPAPSVTGSNVISVPFTSQAPYGNWDALHEEMCEEATLVMAHAWVNGIALTPAYAEQQLQLLAKWGTDNFGTYIDTSARQTAQMGQAVYGLKTRIIDSPSAEDIKNEIDKGSIVIMGMAGRMLHNSNYTPPGPLYHMMLIKGYDSTGFITNDDGTRSGNSYHYSYATLMAAAHDWDGGELTANPAVAIVVSK